MAKREAAAGGNEAAADGAAREPVVLYSAQDGVATITMNRPNAANAQSMELIDALDAAFDIAEGDDDVRVVVLAANGKHFSSGHDLKELVGPDSAKLREAAVDPRGEVPPRTEDVRGAVPSHSRLPEADHRGRPGQVHRRRSDARMHVRHHRGRRRRGLLQPGAPYERRGGRVARRTVGVRDPTSEGVPARLFRSSTPKRPSDSGS